MRCESGRFRCRAIRPSDTPTAAASTLRRARATSSACAAGSLRTACHSSATLWVATGSRRATSESAFSSERASGGASSSARAKEAVTRASPTSTPSGARRPWPARLTPSPGPTPRRRVPARHARRALLREQRVAPEVHGHHGRERAFRLLREAREQAAVEPVVGARQQERLVAVEPAREPLDRHEPQHGLAAAARREQALDPRRGLRLSRHDQLAHAAAQQRERRCARRAGGRTAPSRRAPRPAARTGWLAQASPSPATNSSIRRAASRRASAPAGASC